MIVAHEGVSKYIFHVAPDVLVTERVGEAGLHAMIVMLITALNAAEALAMYHRQRVEETTGTRQAYHWAAARCVQDDIDDIKDQLADGGTTSENHALAMRSLDVTVAWHIIDKHILPEWRASKQASQVLQALAQAIAEAVHAARDGDLLVRQTRQ